MGAVQLAPVTVIHTRTPSSVVPPSKHQKKIHPYYDYGSLLSRNGVFNYLVGGRGLGKTFGAKDQAIKRYIRNGDMFIYVRRYETEIKTIGTFFDDIAEKYPDWDFKVDGRAFLISPATERDAKKRKWTIFGFAVVLSKAQQFKSVAYPRVTLIIFDEFIIEKGVIHYLPGEAKLFLNFFLTVDRGQDKTIVLFLANAVSVINPYFLEYKIRPKEGTEWLRMNDGFTICHFPKAADYAKSFMETRFGKFIQGTEYADYAIGNEFSDNSDLLIRQKDSDAKYLMSLENRLGTFSVWHNLNTDEYFSQAKLPGNEIKYTLLPENMSEEKTLLLQNDRYVQDLRTAYRVGRMFFDNPTTRNIFIDLFSKR
jgi:hypothetical protein